MKWGCILVKVSPGLIEGGASGMLLLVVKIRRDQIAHANGLPIGPAFSRWIIADGFLHKV
jgi:hypothetical protein